jgi:exo-beta-1,3-glucanase (GH17 family)
MKNNPRKFRFSRRQCLGFAGSLALSGFTNTAKAQKQTSFFGLDFSPYMDDQSPERSGRISESQIRERLKVIKPYTSWIRTYGVGSGLEKVGEIAHEMGLKAAVGVWLGRSKEANAAQLEAGITCARGGAADMLVVGSETLLRQDLKTEELCDYLAQARRALPKTIPVTTGDRYAQISGNGELADHLDVFFYNDYPYWGGVSAQQAVARMDEHYRDLKEQAGDKPVWISEHGWPTEGEAVGKAEATPENAAAYLTAFDRWSAEKHINAFMFEAFDEQWKSAREGERGAHWGVWRSDGGIKQTYAGLLSGKR